MRQSVVCHSWVDLCPFIFSASLTSVYYNRYCAGTQNDSASAPKPKPKPSEIEAVCGPRSNNVNMGSTELWDDLNTDDMCIINYKRNECLTLSALINGGITNLFTSKM